MPDVNPTMNGKPAEPSASSPALSGDVLRAYENYQKEQLEAAGAGLLPTIYRVFTEGQSLRTACNNKPHRCCPETYMC